MAVITESSVIKDVQIVEPAMFKDERGFFIETYRREWFPLGREMIQGNRRSQGRRNSRLALSLAPSRLLVCAIRNLPRGAARFAQWVTE